MPRICILGADRWQTSEILSLGPFALFGTSSSIQRLQRLVDDWHGSAHLAVRIIRTKVLEDDVSFPCVSIAPIGGPGLELQRSTASII